MREVMVVESVDHNDDGSTTVYGTVWGSDVPIVVSLPPGSDVMVAVCNHCGTNLKYGLCPNEPHE